MKKSYIILTLLLLVSIAGTYAVYEFYVKERLTEFGEHKRQEERLRTKITDMEEKFFGTEPEVILELWRNKKQPWTNASVSRSNFFQLAAIPKYTEIPEGQITRYYYRDEFRKLERQLNEDAFVSNTSLSLIGTFGVRRPVTYEGTNPSPDEILENLNDYLYGMEMTRLLINAKASTINEVVFWNPAKVAKGGGGGGNIRLRTTGYSFNISIENLVGLLDQMRLSDQYYNVNVLKIVNRSLKDPNSPLEVEMVVTQARYNPFKKGHVAATAEGTADPEVQSMFQTLGFRPTQNQQAPKVGLWKRFMNFIFWF